MLYNTLKNKQGLTEEQFLATYDASRFERPSVSVDMMINGIEVVAEVE